jgi:hypothetical protein
MSGIQFAARIFSSVSVYAIQIGGNDHGKGWTHILVSCLDTKAKD